MTAFWLSLVMAAAGCTGLVLAGKGRWEGWAIGLAVQPVWAVFAVVTKGYGLLLTCLMYGTVYAKNLLKWRREQAAERTKAEAKGLDCFYRGCGRVPCSCPESDARRASALFGIPVQVSDIVPPGNIMFVNPKTMEEVMNMALTKHGHGEVLREPDDHQKTAKENWKPEDDQALQEENAKADQ